MALGLFAALALACGDNGIGDVGGEGGAGQEGGSGGESGGQGGAETSGGAGGGGEGGGAGGSEAGGEGGTSESGGNGGEGGASESGGSGGASENGGSMAGGSEASGGSAGEMTGGSAGEMTGGSAGEMTGGTTSGGTGGQAESGFDAPIFTGPLPPLASKGNVPALPSRSKSLQDELVGEIRGKVSKVDVEQPGGDVTSIRIWNKNSSSGRFDDTLAQKLTTFYKLRSIHIEAQKVGDDGLATLAKFPELKGVALHYMDLGAKPDPKKAAQALAVHRDLELLEIKHNFSGNFGSVIDHLPHMPNLKRLVIDNAGATPRALEFLKNANRVESLEVHRTTMTDEQIYDFLRMMPNLRCVEIKANSKRSLNLKFLKAFKNHKNLLEFSLTAQSGATPYVYKDALEYLTTVPSIKLIHIQDEGATLPPELAANLPESTKLITDKYISGKDRLPECP